MADRGLTIGLVNNMPDAALKATERQFRAVIAAASGGASVELRLLRLPGMMRGPEAQDHLDRHHYQSTDALRGSRIDGLIVTGTEPRAPSLTEEPYWDALADLVDWAEHNTAATIWSCLAAHAAVLHRDGICRQPLGRKLVGLFDCAKRGDHAILAGLPRSWRVPHSRHNGLPEAALRAKGYRLLSWSEEAGVDMLALEGDSLFLFLQGHLEYDAGALYREYRRDVARFLAGERDAYPDLPRGCFDGDTVAALVAFRDRAVASGVRLMADFPAIEEERLAHAWREPARHLYANWLSHLARAARLRRPVQVLALHRS